LRVLGDPDRSSWLAAPLWIEADGTNRLQIPPRGHVVHRDVLLVGILPGDLFHFADLAEKRGELLRRLASLLRVTERALRLSPLNTASARSRWAGDHQERPARG